MGVRAAALAAVLLGFILRVGALGQQSLWYDESYTLLLARFPFGEMLERAARDTNQPLYFWLLGLWGTGPSVDFYPRFLSALAGTASVALVYAVARSLLGARTAAAAALLAAVSPFHVFYSQEVRMYALLGLWNLLAAWGFIQGWFHQRRSGWALYGAATALTLYTHVLGAFIPLALLLWAALVGRGLVPRLKAPALALAAAGLAYLPWAAALAGQVSTVLTTFWAPQPTVVSPFASLYLFFEGPFAGAAFPVALSAVLLALALTLPAVIARPAQRAVAISETPQRQALSFLWAWAALPLAALLALSLVRPLYLERVVLGAAFPVCVLLGWTLTQARPRWLGVALGAAVLGSAMWGLKNWYTDPASGKPPYREAAALVRSQWNGEPVLHTSDGSHLPFLLYAPDLPNRLLAGDPEVAQNTSRARSTYHTLEVAPVALDAALGPRFIVVISLDHSVEFQWGVVEEMDRRYRRASEEKAGGVIVRRYER